MADPRYAHIGTPIIKLAEECAEVIQSCMKIERFGIDNYHPVTKETNSAALLRELADLKARISDVEKMLDA
jgi:hypothetical protein